jgi:eukaryotic translation initiation factor 2C
MLTFRILAGADASHPGAGVRNQPSIASLVWSTNETATTYAAVSGVQDPGQEMIMSLESMLTVRGPCGWHRSLFHLP